MRTPFLVGASLLVAAVAIGVAVWALSREDSSPAEPTTDAVAASEDDLRALPEEIGHPVYWAGPSEDQISTS